MKIDWNLVIALVIAMSIYKLIDALILDSVTEKIKGQFEELSV